MITTPPPPLPSTSTSGTYYSRSALSQFTPLSVLYTIGAHLLVQCLRPFPKLRFKEQQLLPKDCFRPPPAALSVSGAAEDRHVAIVTGSNTGIGFETAVALVERGYDVVLACRSRSKGEEAIQRVHERLSSKKERAVSSLVKPGQAVFLHPLDLSSFASVRSFVSAFDAKYKSLNILVNNAGINFSGESEDKLDLCFQTNILSHYLLTRLLIPHLLLAKNQFPCDEDESEAGRVVNLSSVTHHFCPATEPRPSGDKGTPGNGIHDEEFWKGSATLGVSGNSYRESKLAALLLTMELNRRYGEKGIRSVAVNPGSVMSDIWRNYPKIQVLLFRLFYISSLVGSRPSVAAAIGNLPKDALYLQPYWQPWFLRPRSKEAETKPVPQSFRQAYGVQFPVCEMLGPVVGPTVTDPRLPDDGHGGKASAAAFWDACEEIVEC